MRRGNFDALVIGAGIIGCAVGYELSRAGYSVCVIDRGFGPGQGSTSASSAVIRFNYSTRTGIVAAWESRQLWEHWEEYLGGTDDGALARFFRTGGLCVESPGQDWQRLFSSFDQVGVPYELCDAGAIREHFPGIDTGRYFPPRPVDSDEFFQGSNGDLSGYWTPDSGFVDDPQFATHNLMAAGRRRGVCFRFGTEIVDIQRSETRVQGVCLRDGSVLSAPIVINAGGPHSSRINEMARVLDDFTIVTRPLRQEVHEIAAPSMFRDSSQPTPVLADPDLGYYLRGTPSGRLIIGSMEPECDRLQWVDNPDAVDFNPSRQVYESQVYRAARRFPNLTIPSKPRGVVGLYDVSTDWIPVYDRTNLNGYYVAIGTSGNQFKNAPVVGCFMANIISACENGWDHDSSPVRVTLSITGNSANMGEYSRRREVNPDSSFTVMG